jgi:DNA-binding Lrp family transcriptional regulator
MRGKERLKEKILEILTDNKPEIIPLDEIRTALHIEKAELQDFKQAVKELENEGKIKLHIAIA